jgi:Sortase domain
MATKSGVWRACLSDLLLAAGMLMLLGGALMWARSALAAQEVANRRFLAASVPLAMPMPDRSSLIKLAAGLPSPAPESPKRHLSLKAQMASVEVAGPVEQATPEAMMTPSSLEEPVTLTEQSIEELVRLPTSTASESLPAATPAPTIDVSGEAPAATSTNTSNTPVETQAPPAAQLPAETVMVESNPIVRIEIPTLGVKRAVVPVGLKPDNSGGMSWDTDAIFATNNRPDLVGHLVGSAYPGQGGNIILIGHNYNQVDLGWEGVFVNIKSLQPGDRIIIRGQDGREYVYLVQLVKKVPWRSKNGNELEKHLNFLGPSQSERLTLVTCGGANIWPFPARLYVIAVPEGK